jgi:hypothetical protein
MPTKSKASARPNDEHLYVVYADVREALPNFMRANYRELDLRRQRYNRQYYCPYFKAPRHHSPAYWRVADLILWFANFPLPDAEYDMFAGELRRRATTTPPTAPERRSGAGARPLAA